MEWKLHQGWEKKWKDKSVLDFYSKDALNCTPDITSHSSNLPFQEVQLHIRLRTNCQTEDLEKEAKSTGNLSTFIVHLSSSTDLSRAIYTLTLQKSLVVKVNVTFAINYWDQSSRGCHTHFSCRTGWRYQHPAVQALDTVDDSQVLSFSLKPLSTKVGVTEKTDLAQPL